MTQTYTNKQLETHAQRGNPFAKVALTERKTAAELSTRVEKAERAERDMKQENERLRRRIAELESVK